ncbi:VWA domain-containing protein [Methylomarinum vadi]|uniref:VWA domain-containing protein n=1 Tax=Methylomarinum vadi TaxID=438855 RepID=UPI0004DFAE64|nr:VWA domain-containing protein [Methylomarinum vadi]
MNLAEFHFIRPYWLLALLPAIALIALEMRNRLKRGNWGEVCDEALLPYILQDKAVRQSRWPLTAAAAAALLSIFALAGPTWERLPSPVFRNDAGLVIALDLSRSMNAADIRPSRLIRARYKIADILKQRKDGQTALLVYAGDAFTVTPLTEDNATIANQLNALRSDIMPSRGSNTMAALRLGVNLLKQGGLRQGEILLITDGVDENTIEQASELLGPYRLSVLGVGTAEGAPIKAATGGFVKDAEGNIVVPKLQASRLAKLAAAGGGSYRNISNDDSDLKALLAAVDRPTTESDKEDNALKLEQWDEKGPWLLLLVLPLAALCFRKGLLGIVLILLLPYSQPSHALEWRDLWQTQNQQAQQAFHQQKFEQAAEQFQSPQWKAAAQYKAGQYQQAAKTLQTVDTAEGHYNRGNALAKAGQLQQALEAYRQALKLDPDNEDAKYNKELVEQALQQQQQQNQPQSGEDSRQSDRQQNRQDQQGESSEQQDEQKQDQGQEQQSDSANAERQPSESSEQNEQDTNPEAQSAEQMDQQAEQPDEAEAQQQQPAPQTPMDESEQASEQWLKRIPDDPSGLLKRKFRYQYGQRGRKQSSQDQSW